MDQFQAVAALPLPNAEGTVGQVGANVRSIPVTMLVGYTVITTIALFLRMLTLESYVGHVDEPASLLAISRTAELGYPLFPSGVLYLQGSVFSYLAAPLTWLFEGTALLHASRVLYVLLALAVVPLTMALVQMLTGRGAVVMLAGLLVALDPTLMVWGVSIRPYGLLIVEVLLLVLLFTLVVRDGPGVRWAGIPVLAVFPVVFGVGTFTHIGIWLLLPPLGVVGLMIWGRSLWSSNRAILVSGIACLLPLMAFLVLGELVGTGSGTSTNQAGKAFVGSHLFSWRQFLEMPGPRLNLWGDNFRPGPLHWVMPIAIAGASAGLWAWTRRQRNGRLWQAAAVRAVIVLHWLIVLEVVFLVDMDPDPRYLVHALPLGYVIVALGVERLWQVSRSRTRGHRTALQTGLVRVGSAVVAGMVVFAVMGYGLVGAEWRVGFAGGNPDYWGATQWAAEHTEEGTLILSALPPSAWFWFEADEVAFLAGPEGSNRALRYTKQNQQGEPGDYWLGSPSVQSTGQLCEILADPSRPVVVVVDRARLQARWGFRGHMRDIVVGTTTRAFTGINGTLVLNVLPPDEWSPEASALCDG